MLLWHLKRVSTGRNLSVHAFLGKFHLPSGSLTQLVDVKQAWIVLLNCEVLWLLSFEMCSDAGTEFRSVLGRHELLPCRQTLPGSRAAQGVFVFYLFSSCLRGFPLCALSKVTSSRYVCPSIARWLLWLTGRLEFKNRIYWQSETEGQKHTRKHTHSHCRLVSVYLTSEFSGFIYLAVLEAAPWWPFKKLSSSENVRITWPTCPI